MSEPTPSELMRVLERIERYQSERFAAIDDRMGRLVSTELYAVQQQSIGIRIADVETHAKDDTAALKADIASARAEMKAAVEAVETAQAATEDRRAADRRLAFTALIAPVLLILVQVVIALTGLGP